jgi:type IV pilus assembly protein PilW
MKTQRGISLVELMVSIAIGMLLLLGLGTIFFSVNQTSQLRHGLSDLQNNERMAMMFLRTNIHNAGYYPNPVSSTAATQFPTDGSSFAAGQTLFGAGSGVGGTDILSVRFAAASGVASSQGCSATLNPGDLYRDDFSVSGVNLTCTETDKTTGTAPVSVTLITGLSGMDVQYGVDPACTGSVTEYLTANLVASSVWTGVCTPPLGSQLKTVNVTLTFMNPLALQTGQSAHQTIKITETIPYMNGL